MSAVIVESLSGLLRGIMFGTVGFFIVMILSIVYRYFTNEKLASFLGILFGLGVLGFSGGLLAILDNPTVGGAIEVVAISIFTVWGVNTGDKIAEKMPKKTASEIIDGIRGGRTAYTKIKLPNSRLIYDMAGKPKVLESIKAELSEREFTLPGDLPLEEITKRVKRRLITDWGLGDVELELDQESKVIHCAISAKERGLSSAIPEGKVAVPIECRVIPSNLAPDDLVEIFLENSKVIEKIEVKGVNEERGVITIVADQSLLETILGTKASLVVALPCITIKAPAISVEQKTGEIEEFKLQKIINTLKRIGVTDELSKEIVKRVQAKLSKMDPPISTRLIKATVVGELEKVTPEAAKKLKNRKLWDLKGF